MRHLLLALIPLISNASAIEPTVPLASVELVLHDPTGRPAPSTACDVRLCTSLLELIEGATTSIDFAVYGFRGQPSIVGALEAAKARGVRVRGVIDRTVDGKNYYADSDAVAAALGTVRDDLEVDRRKAANQRSWTPDASARCWLPLPEEYRGPKQCVGYDLGDTCLIAAQAAREAVSFEGDIMHDKFFVVDGRSVWMGSTNVSDSGVGGYNANLVGIVHSPEVAAWYTAEFAQMYEGRYHDQKTSQGRQVVDLPGVRVEGLFSPQDKPMTRGVRPLIQEAKARIDIAIFFLTHKSVVADLIAAHRRGVKVRVILDASGAGNEYSKHELLRAAGIPLKVENWGGKMHMKSAAIDGEHVVIGSMNWTSAGEWGNDENTLLLHGREHAAQYHAFFDRIWEHIPDKWLQGQPAPESLDSTTACTDGSDNDFDHLRDADDPGCRPDAPPVPPRPPYLLVPKELGQPLVKGDVSRDGKRTYFLPSHPLYDGVEINVYLGDALFCSEDDAKAAGFRAPR